MWYRRNKEEEGSGVLQPHVFLYMRTNFQALELFLHPEEGGNSLHRNAGNSLYHTTPRHMTEGNDLHGPRSENLKFCYYLCLTLFSFSASSDMH
jgi:hypothetical protein